MLKDTLPNGLIINQGINQHNYTHDSILLANFVKLTAKTKNILDLCCGNGVVSLMLAPTTSIPIVGVDINQASIDLFSKSIIDNHLAHVYPIVSDINNLTTIIPNNYWDLIICNPPYFLYDEHTRIKAQPDYQIARHEMLLTFEQLVGCVKTLLANTGKFIFIHITERLDEIIKTLHAYNFHISKIQFIYTNRNEASRMIIECCKKQKVHTKILPPLFVDNSKNCRL